MELMELMSISGSSGGWIFFCHCLIGSREVFRSGRFSPTEREPAMRAKLTPSIQGPAFS